MGPKTYKKLTHVNYAKGGKVSAEASDFDFSHYQVPLSQLQQVALHGWGVASGLEITVSADRSGLQVSPGIAIDRSGQLIVLATGGSAVFGETLEELELPKAELPAPVAVPTAAQAGKKVVLGIQFHDKLRPDPEGHFPIGKLEQTPWLRLIPLQDFLKDFQDSDELVMLALADVGADGKVKGDVQASWPGVVFARKALAPRIGGLQLVRSDDDGGTVREMLVAEVRPTTSGLGLVLEGAGKTNQLALGNADLRLDSERRIIFSGDALLSASGDLMVFTGTPPVERLRVRGGISAGTPQAVLEVTGDLRVSGKVNGRNISADGEKLDQAVQQLTAVSNSLRNLLDEVNHLRQQVHDLMDHAPFGIPATWVGNKGVLFDLSTDRTVKIWYDEGPYNAVAISYNTADSKQHNDWVPQGSYKIISAKSLTISGFPNDKGRYLIIPN